MINNKYTIIKRTIFTLVTLFTIGFIFGQSLMPGDKSGDESGRVLALLNAFARWLGLGDIFSHAFVRKCAHFSEFAMLSVFMTLMYNSYNLQKWKLFGFSLLSCAVVASLDETIQNFVPGRACAFTDVLIDTSGSFVGLCIVLFILHLTHRTKKKNVIELSQENGYEKFRNK